MSATGERVSRQLLLDRLVTTIPARLDTPDCCMVGVDGVDAAGKTTFADAFGEAVRARGRAVVRLSLDDFHAPRAVRYRLGRESPAGFWLDSYDYEAFGRDVLAAIRPGGTRRFRRASLDLETDALLESPWETASRGALVIVDGLFLHRDELADVWDYSVTPELLGKSAFAPLARRMVMTSARPRDAKVARKSGEFPCLSRASTTAPTEQRSAASAGRYSWAAK